MTQEQIFEAEAKIYHCPEEFIEMYETGDEQFKEFMRLVIIMTDEELKEYKMILEKECPQFFARREC